MNEMIETMIVAARTKMRSIGMVAAAAGTMMMTGCVSTGGKGPTYVYTLDPKSPTFAAEKEAIEKSGDYAVDLKFVPGPDGKMMPVYGVRETTGFESVNSTLGKFAPVRDTIMQTWNNVNGTVTAVGTVQGAKAQKKTATNIGRVNSTLQTKTKNDAKYQSSVLDILNNGIKVNTGNSNE